MKKLLSILYFSIFSMLLFSITAFAYIDPSAMTYIIQIIAGVAIAAGAAFGFYWRRIKRFFSKKMKSSEPDDIEYDLDDDDDEGYGDYDIDEDDEEDYTVVSQNKEPVKARALESDSYSVAVEIPTATDSVKIAAPVSDPYDEGSSNDALLHENRELRRLLAIEREKVSILKKSLHICTEQK